jgi:hypothetical protein
MDGGQLWQCIADGRLADAQVIVSGLAGLLLGGNAGAHAQTHRSETKKRAELVFREWVRGVIAIDDPGSARQRVGFVEYGVGDGNRQVADCVGIHHIAEIDQPDYALISRIRVSPAACQQVVVVGIVVDDALSQVREERADSCFKAGCKLQDGLAQFRFSDQFPIFVYNLQAVRQIPVEIPVQCLVLEPTQGSGELPDFIAKVVQQFIRVAFDASER